MPRPDLATATWAIWDSHEPLDRERGCYESGFPTRAAALARVPYILAALADLGIDLSLENGDLTICPEWEDVDDTLPDEVDGPWCPPEMERGAGPHDITHA